MSGLLIVDDDVVVRSVGSFIEADGYKVCGEAADGVEAIDRAAELKPDRIVHHVRGRLRPKTSHGDWCGCGALEAGRFEHIG